jgi:hypothetical protein
MIMKLYHVGFAKLENPDVHYGRKNADFGQGFYTSWDKEFSTKWAKYRPGQETVLNVYELEEEGLKIKKLERDEEWFEYIFNNRHFKDDYLEEYDVIIGPIANDTIYDTWGILTSGMVEEKKALEVLCSGPCYYQIALKTEKAASHLTWITSRVLDEEEVNSYSGTVRQEEIEYQKIVADKLSDVMKEIS